ncbi:MAG: aminoacyl-histidine dipeptidase [Bacteroidales bacterium]|nr:MAG: aminoacyl-histidine dipeptidase [Bacteroidales bacterium]
MKSIKDLQPKAIWSYFDEILKIPRPSGKEGKIISFLMEFAEKHKLDVKQDQAGNVLIRKAASVNFENRKSVCLQSHVDMVCEKNSSTKHDFDKDPIQAKIDDNWVKAEGTTLGADNGIGIAAQLAILENKEIKHGPVECLFTVDEEMGLKGAFNIQPRFFDSKVLINLDSEDEGELFIGSAGGINTIAKLRIKTKKIPKNQVSFQIVVTGLAGGHSGGDIDKGRGNSIKILNRFLWTAPKKLKIKLVKFEGGNLPNAIPREAYVIITIPKKNEKLLKEHLNQYIIAIKNELMITEPNLKIFLTSIKMPQQSFNKKSQSRLLNSLYACPDGIIAMSRTMKGLVETSTNLASVKLENKNDIKITTSQRSSLESSKNNIANAVRSVFNMVNARVEHVNGYPGWNPNMKSEILQITKKSYRKLFETNAKVKAIHAGLECGLFLDKYKDLDIISFGPTIKGAHSPDERVDIASTKKFWNLLLEVFKNIPEEKDQ